MKKIAIQFAAGIALVFGFATGAMAQNWTVVQTSGVVRAHHPGAGSVSVPVLALRSQEPLVHQAAYGGGASSVSALGLGAPLVAGSILTTGGDGRVVLRRGEQEIVVGPNARVSLPADESHGLTRILQDAGTLLFRIDKREEIGRAHV